MEPSVPLVKFVKNPLYQEFRYIKGKLIIRYDNPFQTQLQYIKILLMIRYIEVPDEETEFDVKDTLIEYNIKNNKCVIVPINDYLLDTQDNQRSMEEFPDDKRISTS
ncbi:hypothetical protein RhiirB3_444486 [Rhizophagus irregularis]|nr:hypothetical protein RhiirB3_444486 [Rhizophagus irregularis]